MPDGRPGDNPLTDIVVHGEEIFDSESDERIRRLCKGAPLPLLELLAALVRHWPRRDRALGLWGEVAEPDDFRLSLALERCWRDLGTTGH
jgi:hypothetical protein